MVADTGNDAAGDEGSEMAGTAGGASRIPMPSKMIVPVLSISGLVVAVMQTLVAPLLPSLPRLAHTDLGTASWTITATLITGCVANPLLGRLGDMFGKRRMISVSLLSLVVGSVMCGLTDNIWLLIIGRAFQGAALALISLSVSVLRDELPAEKVPSAVATVSATLSAGAALGFPVAAAVIQFANWHTMFWIAAAVGTIDLALVRRFVPESPVRSPGRFDLPGALVLTAVLVGVLVAVERSTSWGWGSWRTLGCLAISLAVGAWWCRFESGRPAPFVDLAVTRRGPVLLTNMAGLFIGFVFYGNVLTASLLVQEPRSTGYGVGGSVLLAGLTGLPGGVLSAFLAPTAARVSRSRGPRVAIAWGCVVMGAGYVFRFGTSTNFVGILVGTSVIAMGSSLAYAALPLQIMREVPVSQTGAANGLNTLIRSVGQAICSAVVAAALAGSLSETGTSVPPTLGAYQLLFGLFVGAAVIGLLLILRVPAPPRTVRTERAG